MYQPKYQITNTLLNNIVKSEAIKTEIIKEQITTKTRNYLLRQSKTLDIFHFAHIIGLNLSLKDAEKVATGKRIVTNDPRGIVLNNLRNILEFNRSGVSDSYVDLDTNILLHLNKIMITDWREDWESKFRTAGESIDLTLENWIDFIDNRIESINIEKELNEVIDWYRGSATKIHPIIRLGTFLHRLIAISPFIFANKLTTIAIADFLFYKHSYVTKAYLPTVKNFDIYEDEYIETWRLNKENGTNDLTLWLERFSRNIAKDLEDVKKDLKRKQNEENKSTKQPFLDLNKRQLKILRYLQTIPTLRREDYVHMMDVSSMTAYRDLNELVQKRLLKVEGKGRGTKYMLYNR